MSKDQHDEADQHRRFQFGQAQFEKTKLRIVIAFFLLLMFAGATASHHYGGTAATASFFLAAISYGLGYWYSQADTSKHREHDDYFRSVRGSEMDNGDA